MTDTVSPKYGGMKVIEEIRDFVLLYFTLIVDQAIPSAYLEHFLTLEPHVRVAVKRADRRTVKITNLSAQRLHNQKQHWVEEAQLDHLVLALELKPKRFRTLWQAMSFQRPTARQDAETAEKKNKWLDVYEKRCSVRIQRIAEFLEPVAELVLFVLESVRFAIFLLGLQLRTNYHT